MRWFLSYSVVCSALIAAAGSAAAGPNAGGVITVHDANCFYTSDYHLEGCCDVGLDPGVCEGIDPNLEGSTPDVPKVWKLYAAFPPGSSPRLKGIAFGIHYDPAEIVIRDYGPCIGDPNNGGLPPMDPSWPNSDSGETVVFQYTQTALLTEFYWFAGYSLHGNPALFQLRDHPDPQLCGCFADDSVPAQLDPVACYGSLGFDTSGETCCFGAPLGACCTGSICTFVSEDACGGRWMGPGVPCEPDPCEATGTQTTTWGAIKARLR